jgi:3-oxo-5-alpha-steroid 4-dehydrogenase 1
MNELTLYHIVLGTMIGLALITFPVLFRVAAPYGRYTRASFGPTLDRTVAWVLQEMPSALGIVILFLLGNRHGNPVAIAFLALWATHYFHRTFVFPFRLRGDRKRATVMTAGLAVLFNLGNVYINGRWLFTLAPPYPLAWLWDPRFVAGVVLFAVGLAINVQSDTILIHLRRPGDTGYRIPEGGFFRWVSCPNYFGELIEWSGWALATWSLPGLVFALWSAANLVPRAWTHHQWYRKQFPDYPPSRRAVIPFLV